MADDAVYWDPRDVEIDADPAPVWKRLRDEAPTYRNDKFDFSASSRFDDVTPAQRDTAAFVSKHGTVLDFMSPDPIPGAEMAANSSLIPNAIEEVLRCEAPSPVTVGTNTRELEYHGVTIPERSRVVLIAGSANRDECHYPDADRFDIHRTIDVHLSFGFGAHFCIGAALARMEGRIALEETLARYPEWEIDTPAVVVRLHTNTIRGFTNVPILV